MNRTYPSALMLLAACAAPLAAADEGRFVNEGRPSDVYFVGQPWTTGRGALTGAGTDNYVYAGKQIAAGDFVVRARLAIDRLGESAASFVIGESHFGFEGRGGEMFTEGPIFGQKNLGKSVVTEGQTFEFAARRQGGRLIVEIDGARVHETPVDPQLELTVGFRPWRSTMRLIEFTAAGTLKEAPKPPPEVDVFESGAGDYHTYRIPAIVLSNKDTLLAFCEGRKAGRGDAGNIDMLVCRSTDLGKTWSEPLLIWDDDGNTCGNPCPVVDRDTGTIWLLLTWNLGSDHEGHIMSGKSQHPRHVYVTHSTDDGQTWASPQKISEQTRKPHWRWYATGPGNAIQLTRGEHKGRLLIPANHSDHTDAEKHPYRSHVFWSDDHGRTWELGGLHEDRTNESAVVELSDGSVLQSMRSYHGRHNRAMATSRDGGKTFGEVYLDDALQTPVCQASILRYSWPDDLGAGGKSRILFSSPAGTGRTHLTVRLSYDEGKTWPVSKVVYAGGSAYSNLVALPDGRIGVLYEKDGYRKIVLATLTLDWLTGGE